MDESVILNNLSNGIPITCATCPFFYQGNGYCGKTECGGPGSGRDFPSYAGPIPREKFIERCLICGNASPTHMIVGLTTKFGLCDKHRRIYDYVGQPDPNRVKYPVQVVILPK